MTDVRPFHQRKIQNLRYQHGLRNLPCFFSEIQDFRFQPTLSQHGIDHLKPKEQTCFKGAIADTSRNVAFAAPPALAKVSATNQKHQTSSDMSNIGGRIASISTNLWGLCRCKWVLKMQEASGGCEIMIACYINTNYIIYSLQ